MFLTNKWRKMFKNILHQFKNITGSARKIIRVSQIANDSYGCCSHIHWVSECYDTFSGTCILKLDRSLSNKLHSIFYSLYSLATCSNKVSLRHASSPPPHVLLWTARAAQLCVQIFNIFFYSGFKARFTEIPSPGISLIKFQYEKCLNICNSSLLNS